MKGAVVALNSAWTVGDRRDGGGFSQVYEVSSDTSAAAVAKFVPQVAGADRELLFVEHGDARNVVPVLDSGEFQGHWVLVMPRADKSLRRHLVDSGGSLDLAESLSVLTDIIEALFDLDGKVVHRDLKPENVLRLGGRWCLTDFAQKFAFTPSYGAPEQWRFDRTTGATDVYAFGVIGHELLTGQRPFGGPGIDEYREQHLHTDPPRLSGVGAVVAALVEECLNKAPNARPSAANVLARLAKVQAPPTSSGLTRLQEAKQAEVARHD
jgi:serine/threonine protein kinase